MPPVRAVVFDLGGVLVDWDPRHLYREVFDDAAEMERFLAEVCTLEWHDAHDRGTPMADSVAALAAEAGEHAPAVLLWAERYLDMVAGPIPGTADVVVELKAAGVPVYALTNMPVEAWPGLLERFPVLRAFDGAIVSGEEGMAKPDAEIFELLVTRFGLDPSTTAFVDDRAVNIEAAERLGFVGVLFRSAAQLRQDVYAMLP
jgi:2-haloacid dehalogenase